MVWAWVSLLIRSGLILAGADGLRRLSRKSGAAYRHRIIACGFALLLLWPAVSALLPEFTLPMRLHRADAVITVTQTMRVLTLRALPVFHVNWPLLVWLLGMSVSLLPVFTAYTRVRLMSAKATRVDDPSWQMMLNEECDALQVRKIPQLLRHAGALVPLTFGIWRPRILLPSDCLQWEPARRRMVLLHELMHVRRRDLLWQMIANFATAVWWFQPLCWTNRRSLRRESEQACDARVLESGIRGSDYATELLQIAQGFSRRKAAFPAAIAMACPGDLEGRLRGILNAQITAGSRFLKLKILLLAGLTVSASAIAVVPNENEFKGGHIMKRTLISGLLASAGLTAATIGGSVFDPNGAAVSNAQAFLYNPDTGVKQELSTTADGKFTFESLPAGSYILRIQKAGFASLYREFNVQTDSDVQRGLVLSTSAGKATQAGEQRGSDANHIRVGGEVEQANLIAKVNPIYPAAAKTAGIQGTVELDVAISKEGMPEDIRVIASPSDDLTQSALEAVRQWRYRPTLLNGQPVAVVTDVIVNYTLLK